VFAVYAIIQWKRLKIVVAFLFITEYNMRQITLRRRAYGKEGSVGL
jgi:hypothetical protein